MTYTKSSLFSKNRFTLYSEPRMCNVFQPLSFSQCIGKKTFIVGESNVGKTEITAKFLNFIQNLEEYHNIYVFDMGPKRFQMKNILVGGKISDYEEDYDKKPGIINYSYTIIPPRSTSMNFKDVYIRCLKNYQAIVEDFSKTIQKLCSTNTEKSILIINDFSIYLHMGSPFPFIKLLKTDHTVFINSYYGTKLANDYNSSISLREKILTQMLMRHFDYVVHLL